MRVCLMRVMPVWSKSCKSEDFKVKTSEQTWPNTHQPALDNYSNIFSVVGAFVGPTVSHPHTCMGYFDSVTPGNHHNTVRLPNFLCAFIVNTTMKTESPLQNRIHLKKMEFHWKVFFVCFYNNTVNLHKHHWKTQFQTPKNEHLSK